MIRILRDRLCLAVSPFLFGAGLVLTTYGARGISDLTSSHASYAPTFLLLAERTYLDLLQRFYTYASNEET